jgi:L-ascorbate metabolism protein UlaG (beta-lactamase superfamily)
VENGSVAAWWLGGLGFVFKAPDGATVCIDSYLSDSVRAIFNQGRAFPPPISPEELRVDAVICPHWHEDHLDPGTIPQVATSSPDT